MNEQSVHTSLRRDLASTETDLRHMTELCEDRSKKLAECQAKLADAERDCALVKTKLKNRSKA